MKAHVFFLFSILSTFNIFAQKPTDFYVAFYTASNDQSVTMLVMVPITMNISYEVMEVSIKPKGADTSQVQTFQVSTRFSKGVESDLNLNIYEYSLPFHPEDDATYIISFYNAKLCNLGKLAFEDAFSSQFIHTISYVNPGYKLINPIKE